LALESHRATELKPGVVQLELTRPHHRNALSSNAVAELHREIDRIGGDPAIRVVIPTGMGAQGTITTPEVFRRMGYGDIIDVTKLFRGGHKDEAAAAIPDELLDDAAIIGNDEHVRNQISRWEASGVTMLVVNADTDEQIKQYASLL